MAHQIQSVQIGPDLLDRWQLVAEELGDHGAGLRLTLREIEVGENARQTVKKAAVAARSAESSAFGQLKKLAGSLATEIETAANS
jgi:hypothetical protein